MRRGGEAHYVTPSPLHVAFDPLRRNVEHVVLGASGVQPVRTVDERRMMTSMGVGVRDVVHLHRGVIGGTESDGRGCRVRGTCSLRWVARRHMRGLARLTGVRVGVCAGPRTRIPPSGGHVAAVIVRM